MIGALVVGGSLDGLIAPRRPQSPDDYRLVQLMLPDPGDSDTVWVVSFWSPARSVMETSWHVETAWAMFLWMSSSR